MTNPLRLANNGPIVRATAPGDVLTWNGSRWVAAPGGGAPPAGLLQRVASSSVLIGPPGTLVGEGTSVTLGYGAWVQPAGKTGVYVQASVIWEAGVLTGFLKGTVAIVPTAGLVWDTAFDGAAEANADAATANLPSGRLEFSGNGTAPAGPVTFDVNFGVSAGNPGDSLRVLGFRYLFAAF